MRQALSITLLLTVISMSSLASCACAQGGQTTTIPMQHHPGGRAVIAVMINGNGPYDFMVDTGTSSTVVDPALFAELKLPIERKIIVQSFAGASTASGSTLREIAIGGLSAHNLGIIRMDIPPGSTGFGGVRGILGEDFLHNFDLLIDNERRLITFDAGHSLAGTLGGDHLVIRFASPLSAGKIDPRPRVSLWVEGFGDADALLDSGADTLAVLRWGSPVIGLSDNVNMQEVNGKLACAVQPDIVHLGKHTRMATMVATCTSSTVVKGVHQGILPTAVFKQVFISHEQSYMIANPVTLPSQPEGHMTLTASSR